MLKTAVDSPAFDVQSALEALVTSLRLALRPHGIDAVVVNFDSSLTGCHAVSPWPWPRPIAAEAPHLPALDALEKHQSAEEDSFASAAFTAVRAVV